jgi:hypothetical protein
MESVSLLRADEQLTAFLETGSGDYRLPREELLKPRNIAAEFTWQEFLGEFLFQV